MDTRDTSGESVYLVTGSMGCIGAWTLYHLLRQGKRPVSFDLSDDRRRLKLLISDEEQAKVAFERGDLTDPEQVLAVFRKHRVTHVIHLAALQVPFCKADPVQGARVNVVGTVNVFEAARKSDVRSLALASSVAVYGPREAYPQEVLPADARLDPRTLYGVYKQANEGTARIYWQDHGIGSITLRPYTVYGVGRDQGLTSEPTKAMLAAAAGRSFNISFGGVMQFHFASDVARQFIAAAESPAKAAVAVNLGTEPLSVARVAELIEELRPGAAITTKETRLPFPAGLESGEVKRLLPGITETPIREGVKQTIEQFEACLKAGLITADPTAA